MLVSAHLTLTNDASVSPQVFSSAWQLARRLRYSPLMTGAMIPGFAFGRLDPGGASGVTDRVHVLRVTVFYFQSSATNPIETQGGDRPTKKHIALDDTDDGKNTFLRRKSMRRNVIFGMAVLMFVLLLNLTGAPQASASGPEERYIVIAKSGGDYNGLKSDSQKSGGKVVNDLREINAMVVTAPSGSKSQIAASTHAQAVVKDRIEKLVSPAMSKELFNANSTPTRNRTNMGLGGGKSSVTPDPAFSLAGLMWNVLRINAPQAWKSATGDPAVLVGVADTGLDFTHSELASRVVHVEDFTGTENPPICKTFFSPSKSDADWAALYGGPANTDWNGHGSWIGGNIAGALDSVGINGIAPNVKLVSLKISQWCGAAYDSEIISAFLYAANNKIDIVSISFGGYLDRTDPDQDAIYKAYVDVVKYARQKGTVIVAAAGNEHIRIGNGGQVISHGPLTIPGDPFVDFYGLWETPGGIPGVVDVSATGNVTVGSSASCPAGTTGSNATCKPASDAHQPFSVGKQNQLTYYSNYGPRIDVAAPGGARKFNLPNADRGGTGGFPYTSADGTTAFEDFSITSNWALEIPCFFNLGPGFYPDECYSTIQGTSMATPHVSAVLALIASKNKEARHHPEELVGILKDSAQEIHGNAEPGLSATDLSAGDRTGLLCPTGYCHLGGPAISDHDAYGAGLVDAYAAVRGD